MLTLLGTKWNDWYLFVWGSNNTLNGMTGKQIFDSIDLIDEICKFMTDNFVTTESQQELLKLLQCWKDIVPFLRTMYIINKNDTKAEKINLKKIMYNY